MFSWIVLILAFASIMPPNAGPDEMHHARSSWYLYENPGELFGDYNFVNYSFPTSLTSDIVMHSANGLKCLPQSQAQLKHCWEPASSTNTQVSAQILYYSPIYYFYVGFFQHNLGWTEPFFAGRVGVVLLSILLLSLIFNSLIKLFAKESLLAMYWILTPPVFFLASAINPSSLEIWAAIILLLKLMLCEKNSIFKKRDVAYISFASLFLITSRPISFVWTFLILLFFARSIHFKKYFFVIVPSILIGMFFNLQLNTRSWKLNSYSSIDANLAFYFEESIRTILNSGNWVLTMFGHLGWTEISMPLVLIFANIYLLTYLYLVGWDSKKYKGFLTQLLFMGLFGIPFIFSLAYASNWPMWWSGRYTIPFLVTFLIFALQQLRSGAKYMFYQGILNLGVMLTLSFWRYGWGLYPTNTPMISEGIQLPLVRIIGFCVLSITWVITVMFLAIRVFPPKFQFKNLPSIRLQDLKNL